MATLHWNQVLAWRLSQQSLHEQFNREHMLDVIACMGGANSRADGETPCS
ncbi:MAG: hypothetical protein GFH27_549291n315 [Chloroflexi bacterium AL-W]|nr:hypothetical protein [Chloroflexi bacterium AL-N1]NOK67217.1 hypothetical protein [Chloroflexi bacterium AL-N10]NOK75289.1 hypothetical protein [Chloroflexi bacterium AL-N5]NOK82077.1 hypothetical protein [Chloroflexi bacterium AL-W]NOK89922.1 hypothetical protein [Chloroflexi bacterium AL-N15]